MSLISNLYELILVNDGSKDNTEEELYKIKENNKDEFITVVSYKDNGGKGKAVREGIKQAKGNYILFMDADLSTDLIAIPTFLAEIQNKDMIIGSRRHNESKIMKPQGFIRKFIGNSCVKITKMLVGMPFKDTQCGFKGFTKELGSELIKRQKIYGWAFDVEYLYIAYINGYTINEIPVKWKNDEDSKVSPIKSSISFFRELIKIRKNKSTYKI